MAPVIERLWQGRPATATMVGAVVVVAGFLLAKASWWFFALAGVGACGPGILRELGVASSQAGFHR